jgi:hypothetical protein
MVKCQQRQEQTIWGWNEALVHKHNPQKVSCMLSYNGFHKERSIPKKNNNLTWVIPTLIKTHIKFHVENTFRQGLR